MNCLLFWRRSKKRPRNYGQLLSVREYSHTFRRLQFAVPNALASGVFKEECSPPVESPSNGFRGTCTSKSVGRNVKGDRDRSGTELRKVSRNWSESHSFCWLALNFLIPLRLKFQPPSGISTSYITWQRFPRKPDLRPDHGSALFSPETVATVPDDFRRKHRISIGDVGILTRYSDFAFAFNIFLPTDHPYNKNKTPDSLHPMTVSWRLLLDLFSYVCVFIPLYRQVLLQGHHIGLLNHCILYSCMQNPRGIFHASHCSTQPILVMAPVPGDHIRYETDFCGALPHNELGQEVSDPPILEV